MKRKEDAIAFRILIQKLHKLRTPRKHMTSFQGRVSTCVNMPKNRVFPYSYIPA